MTLRFIDSFDDRDGEYLAQKWNTNGNWIYAGGRNGTNCMDSPHQAIKILDDQTTWVVGFALYYHTDSSAALMSFYDNLGDYQLHIQTLVGGLLDISLGAGTPFVGYSTAPLLFDEWQYIEIKVVIDDALGSIDIHLDEASIFHADTLDTDYTDVGSVCKLEFPGLTTDDFIDDVYICDGNGTMNNDFLGDCHIECVFPNGEGTPATHEWTNSDDDTASLYTMVDENPPGADRNYSDTLLAVKDVWAFPDIAAGANSILGAQVNTLVRVEDNSIMMYNICRSGGTDYQSPSYIVDNTDYLYYTSIWEQNPDGPVDWLLADFNLAEWGYEREEAPS